MTLETTSNEVQKSAEKNDQPKKPRNDKRRTSSRNRKPKKDNRWTPAQYVVAKAEGKKRFLDFDLPDVVLHGIQDLGFEYCTPIQAETIVPALAGKDIIGKAQTGTGKTAAFLVGLITDLVDYSLETDLRKGEPRALIIAPTRELAQQIAEDAKALCKYTDLNVVTLVGGMDYDKQRKQIASGTTDILVATPGRLIDFVRSKEVDLYNVEVLVLDEADRMLSMGFIPDVRTIIRQTPRKGQDRQTLLYSATFTDEIMNLARQWTVDPVQIEIESERQTTDNVSQKVFLVSSQEKYKLLRNYIRVNEIERVIVFCNRRGETRSLAEKLRKDGFKAALMSGEIPQNKRNRTLEDFRSGKISVLVATDVAGRGIHIDGVTHVVNYQLPEDADDYVHRIGRTGRAGATGTSICFACENDSFLIPEIEQETGVKLECIHPGEELLQDIAQVAEVETAASDNAQSVESAVEAEAAPEASTVAVDAESDTDKQAVEAAQATESTEVAEEKAPETALAAVEVEKADDAVDSTKPAEAVAEPEAPVEEVVTESVEAEVAVISKESDESQEPVAEESAKPVADTTSKTATPVTEDMFDAKSSEPEASSDESAAESSCEKSDDSSQEESALAEQDTDESIKEREEPKP
jgi:ATP-dependent RNA helicase RhlB